MLWEQHEYFLATHKIITWMPTIDIHIDVHHNPATGNGDHFNQWHMQEMQEKLGGKSSSQVQATICTSTEPVQYTGLVQSMCLQN